MKFSREFHNEQQADVRERALRAAGYEAWKKRTADGNWLVIWLVTAIIV